MAQPTQGTAIAALEAARNESQVRAEGSLLGERRASVARLAMVAMFAIISLSSGHTTRTMSVVGASYMLLSVVMLYGVFVRIKVADPRAAQIVPIVTATIDFTMITTMALLSRQVEGIEPGKHAIACAIIMSLSIARRSPWHVVHSAILAEVSWGIVAWGSGRLGDEASIFVMGGLAVLGFMLAMTNRAVGWMFAGLRKRDNLTRFLPHQVAERMIEIGPSALAPVQREVTVLFSDIRGFTSMSEGLEPREVLSMLDDYFGRMSQIVKGHDGVVGKFLGDGLLAFWGVPDRIDDHARRAVRAARDMRTALRELNQHRATKDLPPIKIGIGIHTGNVAAGMLGGELQSEYTIIGDAVNVASRIEGMTKEQGVDLLISETTWGQLGEMPGTRRLTEATVRGRKEPVVLYTIDSSDHGM